MRILFRIRKARRRTQGKRSTAHYQAHKERARALVNERLAHWAPIYGVSYGRVAIRNQRSRWGSCSIHGNLNFNYRIIFLSKELIDYIIVHELCHRIEFNHSPAFWDHVSRTIPNFRENRAYLRAIPCVTSFTMINKQN